MTERSEYVVLGRVVGSGTGWDKSDTYGMSIYDFEPAPDVNLPAAEFMNFDFEGGIVETFDDDGTVTLRADLVKVMANLPAKENI